MTQALAWASGCTGKPFTEMGKWSAPGEAGVLLWPSLFAMPVRHASGGAEEQAAGPHVRSPEARSKHRQPLKSHRHMGGI